MRKTWEGKLILAAVLLVTAAGLICLAIWRNRVSGPGLLFFFLLIAAAIIAAAAAGILAGVIEQYTNESELNRAREAAAWERAQPEVVKLEAYAALVGRLNQAGPEVLQVLSAWPELARIIAGNFGPVAAVVTNDGEVPYTFVNEWYLANKDREVLIPVSQWQVAGNKQRYASWLERHLIAMQFLVSWGGRSTAKWASPKSPVDFLNYFYGDTIQLPKESEAT